jgi:threonine synthase
MSGDTELVAELMAKLNKDGSYTVPENLLAEIQTEFWAGCCDDEGAKATMAKVFSDTHYLCDPHTAAGWAAAEDYIVETDDHRPMVVLSTASPYKFPVAVLTAIGGDTSGSEFDQMERLCAITGVPIPANLSGLQGKPERHTGVIEKDAMLEYVLNL